MESNVIPLPHQLHALARAIAGDRIRYLLADEVGLGKTIEAGLVLRELKLRGLIRRTLVVAPKGLATQWVSEMRTHFNEDFQLILGEDLALLKRMNAGNHARYWTQQNSLQYLDEPDDLQQANPWRTFNQVIVSLDSVKPLEKRRGWSQEKIEQYNSSRFEDLITAGWDLVIIDESHRLGGSTDQVARYKLGRGLAEASPYLLLLSATPHQGKSDAFHRLLTLLDAEAFPDEASVTRKRVAPFVIRTEKRNAIDAEGKPLFKPRRTQTVPVRWETRHALQQLLYEAVTDYVREGYNQAQKDKKHHIGFLMILMQRLVVSSTRAIRTTLERRLTVLKESQQRTSLHLEELENGTEATDSLEDYYDMDGQELLDELLKTHGEALQLESSHVETLLNTARQCEQAGPDAKAETLLEWIYQLQSKENEVELKILIFTEFVPTQAMLKEFLEARGISVATLNGSMAMEERERAQEAFREQARVLVSTDAGGEGLNLQFCHVIINYDIPWNPMRLEQRIGRVDRIGQPKTVQAINFLFEESVEFRVREVLEQKLAIIFEEFGIDKTGDVLDSGQAGELFGELFASALLNPDSIEVSVAQTMTRLREEIREVKKSSALYDISEEPDVLVAQHLRSHPLPHWLETMTLSYLKAYGGKVNKKRSWSDLTWPDGQEFKKCVFTSQEAERLSDTKLLNLENNRVRGLVLNLPQTTSGQPLPCVSLANLPATIKGSWGLFEIRIQAGLHKESNLLRIPAVRRRYTSVFLSEEGKLFLPTARHIWDALQTAEVEVSDTLVGVDAQLTFDQLLETAELAGQQAFEELRIEHLASITSEEERGRVAFTSRRKAIAVVGLPEVRQYRLVKCDAEESNWRKELESARDIVPEIRPLLLMRIMNREIQ
jgi:superfamily II DNA or RNA helicase